MEHPILFLNILFQKLGLPVVGAEEAHTLLEQVLQPHVTYTWLVMIVLLLLAKLAVSRIQLVPEGGQNFFEVVINGIEEFMIGITGEHGRFVFPLIATLGFFILLSNYLGMIPGFFSPTANINTTAACALIVVVFTHVIGVKFHGAKYIKHFMGPVWWLTPLIMPIEIIGHIARVLSLSIRLFGNVFGEELVLGILFFLAGLYLAPLPMMFLGLFTGFIQAFIFCLLSMMYFAGALEEAH
ncbi:F0F1 ATP synthase subunit A [Desulforhabdus amnigena]|uniref:ATP synthase subunit a n=1 Tax=Desulforhabdus amnigena TaxID=40218 RepID=A0A9W6D3Q7_9BACT|nr:F0F1 ATP synthase subunit A [Desulforhabdus amnigena]NLJ27353.1 F0F1 ATP synthase subunit A [Deltaproteobacteria bacterium]GLI34708.1 ATP synthase subunit a [Desulforhabdus amnigena]